MVIGATKCNGKYKYVVKLDNKFMKTILFSFMLILLAEGCRKSNNNSNIASNEIFPDKVGDTWHYLVYDTTTSVVII